MTGLLSREEIKALPWLSHEQYALVNRYTKQIILGASDEESLQKVLREMSPKHPDYIKMLIVKKEGV